MSQRPLAVLPSNANLGPGPHRFPSNFPRKDFFAGGLVQSRDGCNAVDEVIRSRYFVHDFVVLGGDDSVEGAVS